MWNGPIPDEEAKSNSSLGLTAYFFFIPTGGIGRIATISHPQDGPSACMELNFCESVSEHPD